MTVSCLLLRYALFFRKGKRKSERGVGRDLPFPDCLFAAGLSAFPDSISFNPLHNCEAGNATSA